MDPARAPELFRALAGLAEAADPHSRPALYLGGVVAADEGCYAQLGDPAEVLKRYRAALAEAARAGRVDVVVGPGAAVAGVAAVLCYNS